MDDNRKKGTYPQLYITKETKLTEKVDGIILDNGLFLHQQVLI